jgi:hypothetical protein
MFKNFSVSVLLKGIEGRSNGGVKARSHAVGYSGGSVHAIMCFPLAELAKEASGAGFDPGEQKLGLDADLPLRRSAGDEGLHLDHDYYDGRTKRNWNIDLI